ncbi:MAG: PQQ-like beta-propeller repeat protein, partial [Candidatus Aminicenantes bacterium]|nr:PQQ-like beta-propeller repeat protein [Candidatus Aminicenantes bacterium]
DPFPLGLPLVEAGSLEVDGRLAGQPRARDGIVYLATSDGRVTALVPSARSLLWRFNSGHPLASGPEIGPDHIVVHDDAGVLHVLDHRGAIILERRIEERVTTTVREEQGRVFFGTADGMAVALDIGEGGTRAWAHRGPGAGAAMAAGPVFADGLVVFGRSDGVIKAFDRSGRPVWERQADGACRVDPVYDRGRLYFGTEGRRFYCLRASTGKQVWSRRLQGAPAQPAVVVGRRIVVAASNSVVYVLAGRGGSILAWEAVPSRILYQLSTAGALALVSSAAPEIAFLDANAGKVRARHAAAGTVAAGALWVPPFVVLAEEDEETGRQRLSFFRTGARAAAATKS